MKKFAFLFLSCVFCFSACNKEDVEPAPTVEEERQAIMAYMVDNNLSGVELASGTFVVTETEGTGVQPDLSSQAEVRYSGAYTDGEVFDATVGNSTAVFNIQGVIAGFRDGLLAMKVGGKAKLIIPAHQGYGQNPPNGIRSNAILIFSTELVGIL